METKLAVFVNQIGYEPKKSKFAYATGLNGTESFSLVDKASNKVVFTSKAAAPKCDRVAGEDVCCLDFSDFTIPGTYFISITSRNGQTVQSFPVIIQENIYCQVYFSTLYALQ